MQVAGVVVHFFDAFDTGRLGHDCESCPAILHLGQALSEPGQDAMTLKPNKSKKGVADNILPAWSFKTRSQQFDWSGVPLYM